MAWIEDDPVLNDPDHKFGVECPFPDIYKFSQTIQRPVGSRWVCLGCGAEWSIAGYERRKSEYFPIWQLEG